MSRDICATLYGRLPGQRTETEDLGQFIDGGRTTEDVSSWYGGLCE